MTMARIQTQQQLEKIIQTVDELMYHKGFNAMSFKDIAAACDISKGNLYYYFKTKEELLQAVINYRTGFMKQMLKDWEGEYPDALQRLKRYVQIAQNESAAAIKYGCPMGSLNTELGKSQADLQKISREQFDIFKVWIKKQFKILLPNENAEFYALRLMARTQGIVVIAQAYADEKFILREVVEINQWLDSLV